MFSSNESKNSEIGDQATNAATDIQLSAYCSKDAGAKQALWLEASTKFLLTKVKELRPKVGKTASLRNKKQMWAKIAEELQERGHNFNSVQVEAKFFNLERQYRRMQFYNSKTGRNRSCTFRR